MGASITSPSTVNTAGSIPEMKTRVRVFAKIWRDRGGIWREGDAAFREGDAAFREGDAAFREGDAAFRECGEIWQPVAVGFLGGGVGVWGFFPLKSNGVDCSRW
jgi:hypothetical protein